MARKIIGTITSDVQDKTIIVASQRRVTHPVYGKQYTVTKKFVAHDEDNQAHLGDKVEIVETRPISKTKTWRLSRVIEAGQVAAELKDETEELVTTKTVPKPKPAPKAEPAETAEKATEATPRDAEEAKEKKAD